MSNIVNWRSVQRSAANQQTRDFKQPSVKNTQKYCNNTFQNMPPYTTTNSIYTTGINYGSDSNTYSGVASSADGKIVVAVSNTEGMFISVDAGQNWNALPNQPQNNSPANWTSVAMSADGNRIVAVLQQKYKKDVTGLASYFIYSSPDAGKTWIPNLISTGFIVSPTFTSVACSADGTKIIAVSSDFGMYYGNLQKDNTIQFDALKNGPGGGPGQTPANWTSVAMSADGTRLVAVITTDYPSGINGLNSAFIYSSPDAGNTWVLNTLPTGLSYYPSFNTVVCSADGTKVLAVSSDYGMFYGTFIKDQSFNTFNFEVVKNEPGGYFGQTPAFWSSASMSANGTKLVAVLKKTDNGLNSCIVYTSLDAGASWSANSISPAVGVAFTSIASSINGSTSVAVTSTPGYGIFSNSSGSWQQTF